MRRGDVRRWGWWLCVVGLSGCGAPAEEWAEDACADLLPGDVVITEYLNDPDGTDTGREYVELHNPLSVPVSLEGLTLHASRSDGSQEKTFLFDAPLSLAPGDYLVLGDVREGTVPAHVDLSYGDSLGALGNSSGRLGLRCGSRVVDEVPLTAPAKSGVARVYDGRLVPDSAGNDDPTRWCDSEGSTVGGGFQGSPGAANAPCAPTEGASGGEAGVERCSPLEGLAARPVRWPRVGELVITELMVNPIGDDTSAEWVEVLALAPVDLNGLTVGSDTSGTRLQGTQCLSLPAGGSALLARRADAVLNGGLPTPLATFGVDLRNAGGVVLVRAGDVVVDAVEYGPAREGVATQVSVERANASDNDSLSSWCPARERYGERGNLGTPGRGNARCTEGDTDAGTADGGGGDAGASDAGRDAGSSGGGSTDGGRDAGSTSDAGPRDAGPPDAGPPDAGPPGSTCIDRVTGRARAVRVPEVGSLVLTELMADPTVVADGVGEWVEILATREVDLNGVTMMNESGASTPLDAALCLSLRTGSRAVLARSLDPALNGGLPAVLATFSFNLANTAGARSLRLMRDGRVLDAISWSNAATPGVSWQVDPASSDAQRNDLPGSFCAAPSSARYGLGDRGTPGLENRACPR